MTKVEKVVCVHDDWIIDPKKFVVVGESPKNGEVFVISESTPLPTGGFGLRFIGGPDIYLGMELAHWNSSGFRLLDEMKKSQR